jgi:hypothetical protein
LTPLVGSEHVRTVGKILSHTTERNGTVEGFGSKKTPPENTVGTPPHIGPTTPPPAPEPAVNRFGRGVPGHPTQSPTPMPTWP